ncbi:MAG: hypothetical protein EA389_09785 [Ilumatobacter sp.]|nr:MAG: hypothetical protein EA389_09785 [Ilumatobacter sp.]
MLDDVFAKTLRDQRRAVAVWAAGIVATVAVLAGLWPSVREMFDDEILGEFPEVMQRLFDMETMTTGSGFLNIELFSIVLPVVFITYGIGRGSRLIAGEEQDGTLEVVIVSPVTRSRILLDKAAGLAIGVSALGAALFAATVVASAVAGMGVPVTHAAIGAVAMVLLGIQHGWLALAVGAAFGRRGLAVAVAGVVAMVGYLLHVMGALVEAVAPWQPLSPFTQAVGAGPVSGDVPLGFLWLALSSVAFVSVAMPRFDRRDIGTA